MTKSERILGVFDSGEKTNLMILVGALHGNEVAGLKAIKNVFSAMEAEGIKVHGKVVGVKGNLQAIAANKRFIDYDMNRCWKEEHVAQILAKDESELVHEDLEVKQLYTVLDEIASEDYQHKYVIDLHTTSADNGTFLVHPGTPAENSLARSLRIPTVVNLHSYLPGTLLNYMTKYGCKSSFAFEGGQIGSKKAVDIHTAGVWELLYQSGVIEQTHDIGHQIHFQELLASLPKGQPDMVRVLHRHEVGPKDYFHMKPGYQNFQHVEKGELLAEDKHGKIHAPLGGLIFMPLYQNAGNDGFFVVEEV